MRALSSAGRRRLPERCRGVLGPATTRSPKYSPGFGGRNCTPMGSAMSVTGWNPAEDMGGPRQAWEGLPEPD